MQGRDFSLQPALSYKQHMEEICQLELLDLENCYSEELQTLDVLFDFERRGLEELAHQHLSGMLDVDAIGVTFIDLQALRLQIDRQTEVVQDMAEQVSKKRCELIEIAKEKKALEKLKEKHELSVAQAVAQAENRVMEEIATVQFRRRGHE